MAEENILLKVGIDESQIKRSQDAIISARSEIEKLKATQKDLADKGQANSKAFIENETQIRKYSASVRENQRVLDANAKISKDAGGSIADLRANVKRLQNEYINLSAAERDNTDAGKNLQKQIKAQNDELKKLEEGIGITSRSVGDYTNSIISAFDSSGLFTKAQSALATAQKTVKSALDGGALSAQGFGKALIATGIGAIVVLLGSLITYLLNTQKGMDAVAQATEAVGTFVGVVFDAFGKLGAQVLNSIIPTFTGLGKILEGVFTLDFDKVTEGIDGVKKAVDGVKGVNILELGANASKAASEAVKLTKEMQELTRAEKALELERKQARAQIAKDKFIAEDTTKSLKERAAAAERAIGKENELLEKSLELQAKIVKNIKDKNELTTSTDEDINRAIEAEGKLADLQQESTQKSIELNNKLNGLRKEGQAAADAANKAAQAQKDTQDAERLAKEAENLAKEAKENALIEEEKLKNQKEANKKYLENLKNKELESNSIAKEAIEDLKKQFIQGSITPEQYQAELDKLAAVTIATKQAAFELELEQTRTNTQIDADTRFEIEKDLQEKIAGLKSQALDISVANRLKEIAGEQKLADEKKQLDQSVADAKEQLLYSVLAASISVFGKESAAGKAAASFQVLLDTFIGARRAYNSQLVVGDPSSPARGAIVAAATVIQGLATVAKINSTPPPKFEDGGSIGVVGSSHAGGGVDLALGGRTVANVEGGEGIFVMKKNAYSALRNLSSFNEMHGGNSWFSGGKTHLADGGAVARSGAPTIDRRMFQDNSRALESSIGSMTIVTKITDLERVQQDVRTVEITSDLV
jgi:uncharacterized protein YqgV (UPF0045/DUF77 family)